MFIGRRSRTALAIIVAIGISQSVSTGHSEEGGTEINMKGEALHVCAVVFDDFSKHLLEYSSERGELARYVSDVANYDVEVKPEPDSYEVTITPTQRRDFPINGGGGRYRVSARDAVIRERVFFK